MKQDGEGAKQNTSKQKSRTLSEKAKERPAEISNVLAHNARESKTHRASRHRDNPKHQEKGIADDEEVYNSESCAKERNKRYHGSDHRKNTRVQQGSNQRGKRKKKGKTTDRRSATTEMLESSCVETGDCSHKYSTFSSCQAHRGKKRM